MFPSFSSGVLRSSRTLGCFGASVKALPIALGALGWITTTCSHPILDTFAEEFLGSMDDLDPSGGEGHPLSRASASLSPRILRPSRRCC